MNCKPNDMAYISIPGPHHGKIVRVLRIENCPGSPAWEYEGFIQCEMNGDRYESLWDDILRPLGNPGQNEVDQVLRRVPAPGEAVRG